MSWEKSNEGIFGCRARNRTWVKGFKVLRATSTQRGNILFPVYRCRRSGSNRHESRLSTVFETVASANSATPAKLERKTRLELATSSLARRHSTTELLPPAVSGAEAQNRTGDT